MNIKSTTYTLCEVKATRRNRPRYAENLIEQGQAFKAMRQSLALSRPATVKLLRVSLRTLHNWETGKVRIPYAAFKLIRLFNSYEIFHPIWKDWRIVGSRLITPEGRSIEASNFHWLSLMARRADAFSQICQENRSRKEAEKAAQTASASGLVFNSTSAKLFDEIQQIQASHGGLPPTKPTSTWQAAAEHFSGLIPPLCNTGGKNPLFVQKSPLSQQKTTFGGAL